MPLQSEQILELIAITGEFPAAVLQRLPYKESYRYKLITDLKNKKLIKLYTRDKLKGYKLTFRARELLMSTNPARFEFFLTGNAETNKKITEYKRRLRLHHTADVTVTLSNAGVRIYPDEKPCLFSESPAAVSNPPEAAFYYSREMKSTGKEHMKIRGSRATGAMFTNDEIFLVYNTGSNLMKWENAIELRCKAFLTSRFCQETATAIYSDAKISGLMTGIEMDMALPLLTSDGGYKRAYFYLDNTFERFYYAPNTSEGETQVKILCSGEIKTALSNLLLSDLTPKNPCLRIENDALNNEGVPVLLAFDFDLERLRRFRNSLEMFDQRGVIYCFDFQKPPLETYLGILAKIETISLKKVKERFRL